MKKIFLFIIVGLFLISLSSAFGEVADFDDTDGEYGSYSIESGWGILPKFLGGGDLAWVKLTENTDQCLINCYAKGEGFFNEPKNFLDGLEFKNRLGEDETSLEGVKIFIGQLEEVIKQKPIYEEVCEEMQGNETNQYYTNCYSKLKEYEDYTDEEMIIKEYEGEDIIGNFIWEIRAKKSPYVSVDWIVTIWGEKLEAWAWWDTDWNKKRKISNLNGTISTLYNITYDADMKADFGDLRFLDNATESIELNYSIINKTDSTSAMIRVDNLNISAIMMYYENPSVNTTENFDNLYFSPELAYTFDNSNANDDTSNNNNATVNGATITGAGYLGNAYIFDGINDNIITDNKLTSTEDMTFNFWFKTGTTGGIKEFMYAHADTWAFGDIDTAMGIDGTDSYRIFVEFYRYGTSAPETIVLSSTTTGFNDDEWHQVTLLINNKVGSLYVDNILEDSGSAPNARANSDGLLQIGSRVGSIFFDGEIDEFYVYDYLISLNLTQYLYEQTQPNFTIGAEETLGATVTLISPEDALITTQTFQTFGCNASFISNIANLTLIINGVDNFTNSTVGTLIDLSFPQNLTQAIYIWSCRAEIAGGQITQSENRTLTVHTTIPNAIIHDPQTSINYFLLGENLTLNWTVSEQGENLTEHIKNCTYEYNEVITVLNNTLCTQINQTSFTYVLGVNNLTFNITDIFDLVNSTIVEWDINLTEINQTFNNETLEGATETFSSMIRLGAGKSISIVALMYNETITAGTISTVGENIKIQLENFIIPQVETQTNITFYLSVVFSDGEVINLSSQNQTIENIALDNCSSFSNEILNMTMVDEEMQFILSNTSLEVAINLLSVDRTQTVVSLSGEFDNENPLSICISENITGELAYSLDAIIKYTSQGYAIEYYNLVNSPLDNETTTQPIRLYNLNASDSTDFQLTFTGEDFLPVEDALVFIERQYIAENTFKTVELPKTDANGQTILHLVRNDIIYNIRIVKDGEVLGNFANVIAFCEDFTIGACSLPLNALSNISLVFDYDDEIGLIFQEETQYNETTGIASFSFSSTDGSPKVVSMDIERRDIFGNRTICQNTVVASSGTLSCQVDPNIEDTSLISIISVDGEAKLNSEITIDSTAYGQNGYAMFFIFAIGIFLMFSGSKTWTLIGISLEYIIGVSLGLIVGGIAGAGSTGIFVLIISLVGIWQLNKDRKQ